MYQIKGNNQTSKKFTIVYYNSKKHVENITKNLQYIKITTDLQYIKNVTVLRRVVLRDRPFALAMELLQGLLCSKMPSNLLWSWHFWQGYG